MNKEWASQGKKIWLKGKKNLLAKQETWVQPLGQEGSLEEEMAPHSSILAWKIPWTDQSGGQQPMGCWRVGHDLATKQEQSNRDLPFSTWNSAQRCFHCFLFSFFPTSSFLSGMWVWGLEDKGAIVWSWEWKSHHLSGRVEKEVSLSPWRLQGVTRLARAFW